MSNKKKSFISFLNDLSNEIQIESEIKKSYKKIENTKPSKKNTGKRKKTSITDLINDLVENIDQDFGDLSKEFNKDYPKKRAKKNLFDEDKPDLEAQRRLKAELRNKHEDKFKNPKEGDSAALKRLKEAEQKEKIDKIREELAKEKNRQRLKDAIIMAEILGPPVSKRR